MLSVADVEALDLVNTDGNLEHVLADDLSTGTIEVTVPPDGSFPRPRPDLPEWAVWGACGAVITGLLILLWRDRD